MKKSNNIKMICKNKLKNLIKISILMKNYIEKLKYTKKKWIKNCILNHLLE